MERNGKNALFLLLTITITLFFTTIRAQSQTCRSYSFTNNQQFTTCNDLPVLNAHLYWSYNSTAGTANIAYRVAGVSSSNWVAWALNPNSVGMIGAQALVAYRNSSGAMSVYTSSVTSTGTQLAPSSLSFPVLNISAQMTTAGEIIIFATIRPPRTTVNQVWQVGPLSGNTPQGHPTSGANTRSTGTIDFLSGQTTSSGAAVIPRLRKKNVHGVLNAVSWGILLPIGAIIARYMKVFKSADPAWFYLHIACQLSAYAVGVAGWGLGLSLGSESSGVVYHSHRNIGISLFCLATLQVFALLMRPNKEHKHRIYWNIYHYLIGYAVIVLSIVNIFKGFDILDPEKKWKRAYIGILIALGAIAVFLEAFTWLLVLKRKKDNNKHGHHVNNGANGDGYHNNNNINGYAPTTQPVV